MYRDTMDMEHEMYDYTGNNWSHQNSNKRFKEKCGVHIRKTLKGFPTKDSYTRNTTHYRKYCSLKSEPGGVGITDGSREYHEEKDCA